MVIETNWKECVEQGIITRTEPDLERSQQMLKMAQLRQQFWEALQSIVRDEYAALFVEAYYDIVKIRGWRTAGQRPAACSLRSPPAPILSVLKNTPLAVLAWWTLSTGQIDRWCIFDTLKSLFLLISTKTAITVQTTYVSLPISKKK